MANELSKYDMEMIKDREEAVKETLRSIEESRVFKLGDFLIAFTICAWSKDKVQSTNSYGAPKKYKVIFVDSNGIPYIKEINKKGYPVGNIISTVSIDGGVVSNNKDLLFEVDPDYTDAIILQDEENFDASLIHKMKSDTFKEITQHNKTFKVNTSDHLILIEWFNSNVKVGTVLHRSAKSHFTVLETSPIVVSTHAGIKYGSPFCLIQDSKGKTKLCSINNFIYKALYTQRPRSYGELKDPK